MNNILAALENLATQGNSTIATILKDLINALHTLKDNDDGIIVFDVNGNNYVVIVIQVLEHDVSAYSNVTHVYIVEFPKIFLIEN